MLRILHDLLNFGMQIFHTPLLRVHEQVKSILDNLFWISVFINLPNIEDVVPSKSVMA